TFDHGVSEPKALGALEKLFASAGEVIPNQIPVRSAVDRLVNEFQAVPEIQNTDNGLLIKEAIVDSNRAARTLAGVSGWQNDDQVLAKVVIAGLPANGFALVVARYSPQQWKELRTALTSEMRPR
ncbi:MAG: hypothetical protein Q8O00_06575, partial [Holophaga sp.]|nr:hypothetical protein [Holophaga sp.]